MRVEEGRRDVSARNARPPGPTRGTSAGSHPVRPDLADRPRPDRQRGTVRWGLPAGHQRQAVSSLDLLLAYKQQPMIEKRFPQLKTDFVVAPVFLKEVSRIQALLCVYFFACSSSRCWNGNCDGRWSGRDREPAPVSRGPGLPPPHSPASHRPVRGPATTRTDGRWEDHHLPHKPDPRATPSVPPAGNPKGL